MKKLALVLSFLSLTLLSAQNPTITEDSEISIITYGSGDNLNDAFGHNGIRVKTPYIDIIYDYGRFDFKAPNFYTNFARGKLLYWQGVSRFDDVVPFYKQQNRTIKEQVLNLSLNEKRLFYDFLINNSQPKNREYLYDFFYDNCATKIRDVSEEITNKNIQFNTPEELTNSTFRDLIQDRLDWNSWGSFGIDVALGSVIDREATPYEHMFLPEYIHTFFEKATFKNSGNRLVKSERVIYTKTNESNASSFVMSPLFILTILSIFIIWITFKDSKNKKRSVWLDAILFSITGLIGIALLLLWFATDHTATAHNYNLLWACPISIVGLIQILKKRPKRWFTKYLKFLIIMLCLLTFHWLVGVQRFAIVLIPLLIALLIRYVFLINYYKKTMN